LTINKPRSSQNSFSDILFFEGIFKKLMIFVNKNWPNDSKIGYKSPSNLLEFFETDMNLEDELEELEKGI
jgi:hypothetical protein